MRRPRRVLAAVLAALVVLAACDGSPADDPHADLRARVGAVQAAVDARDAETARSALNGLREALANHRASGEIELERAEEIARAADYVELHLDELEATPTEEAAPEEEATPEPEPEPEDGDGNGNGGGGDDGDEDDGEDDGGGGGGGGDGGDGPDPPGQGGDPPGRGRGGGD